VELKKSCSPDPVTNDQSPGLWMRKHLERGSCVSLMSRVG
jgi:hypothetical protein